MIYKKTYLLFGLFALFNLGSCSFFDYFDEEIIMDYNPDIKYDSFISNEHNLKIDIFCEPNYLEGNIHTGFDSLPSQVKHVKIYNIEYEPDNVFFNGEQLFYLNWYYNLEDQSIEIVNIDHNLIDNFQIFWTD